MLSSLDAAVTRASDDLVGDPIPLANKERWQQGRSRIEIDKTWLAFASQGMTLKDIADKVGCHPRTVRRRLLDHHLAEPAPPVIQNMVCPDGTVVKEWHPTGPTWSQIRDDPARLDELVRQILERYSKYSIGFVKASLRNQGHRVSQDHIRASLIRVRGLQPRFFNRPIERRVYSVPEVNSLWHHDGNHSKKPRLISSHASFSTQNLFDGNSSFTVLLMASRVLSQESDAAPITGRRLCWISFCKLCLNMVFPAECVETMERKMCVLQHT